MVNQGDLYSVFPTYVRTKVQMGMISQQDESLHKILRKPFASVYSTRALDQVEPRVTDSIHLLLQHLAKGSVDGREVDLGFWLQMFVWDVLCSTMFSKRLGFLDRGEDVGNMLAHLREHFRLAAPVGLSIKHCQ